MYGILGIKQLTQRDGVKLEHRWKELALAKNFTFYHFGQNIITSFIPLAVQYLIMRDYKLIYGFKKGSEPLGAIFVPEEYIPARPNIQSLDKRIMDMSLEGEKASIEKAQKYEKDRVKAIGDMTERQVYESLKSFYKDKKETVLVIQDLPMLDTDQTYRKKNDLEMDYVLVNHDLALIINIEVKTTLTEESCEKVCLQLSENENYFDKWFTCDISKDWSFVSMVYVNNLSTKFKNFQHDLLAVGIRDFEAKLQAVCKQTGYKYVSKICSITSRV